MVDKEKGSKIILSFFMILLIILKMIGNQNSAITILWILIGIICYFLSSKENRSRRKNEKIKVVIILVAIYEIIYLLLGLKVGYQKSPYSLKMTEILKNIGTVFSVPIFYEIIRTKLIKSSNTKISYVLITLFFIFVQIEFEKINATINLQEILEYTFGNILVILLESILLTFLSYNGSYVLNLSYTIPIYLSKIVFPIFPNLDWFSNAALQIFLFLLIFLFVNYEDTMTWRKSSKKQIRKETPIKTIPVLMGMVILVSFVVGFLPYKPVAVVSNSMVPHFKRGDVCIVKQITDYKQIKKIKEGDIIEYQMNDIFIIHRVLQVIKTNQGLSYITKGDNNQTQDLLPVEEEQIVGKVTYIIPFIGYPSVWFSEWVKGRT